MSEQRRFSAAQKASENGKWRLLHNGLVAACVIHEHMAANDGRNNAYVF